MKRKIFCLTICLLCIVAALVSCKGECVGHADADKNTVCDNCGLPVVTITEEVEKEEEVIDMIVSAIPEGATIGNVELVAFEKAPVLQGGASLVKQENVDYNPYNLYLDKFIFFDYEEQIAGSDTEEDESDDQFKVTWAFCDIYAQKTIVLHTGVYTLADSDRDNVTIERYENFNLIKVNITDYVLEPDAFGYYDYSDYYSIAGNKIASTLDAQTKTNITVTLDSIRDDIAYIIVNEEKLAINPETGVVIYKADKDTFVERPTFTSKNEKFGFVRKSNTIYAYDLSKWLECVYSYDISGAYVDAAVFYLNDGKVLVQGIKPLPTAAVNYDVMEGGKYDIVYTLIDVAAETKATEIEFGYYIDSVKIAKDQNEAVKYVFNVTSIDNKYLDKDLTLYLDESLNIIAEESAILPEFVSKLTLVSDNVFLGTVVYGEGSSVDKLYDATGKELLTLPNKAVVKAGNWIKHNGKYYDFTMQLILDPMADEDNKYNLYNEYSNYAIFYQGSDYYYWNATMTAPKLIVDASNEAGDTTQALVSVSDNYFILRTTTNVEGNFTSTYSLYNANGAKVLDSEETFRTVVLMKSDDAYSWIVTLNDGTVYLGK